MNRKNRILFLMDQLIDQCLDLDFDLQQINSFFDLKVIERGNRIRNISILIVDCNREHLSRYIPMLSTRLKVSLEFELLDQFQSNANAEYLRSYDLIVTTFTHYDEVSTITEGCTDLIGIDTFPNLKSMVRIAGIPLDRSIGIIADAPKFMESLERAMAKAGIEGRNTDFLHYSERSDQLMTFLQTHDPLIVSPRTRAPVLEVLGQTKLKTDVIPFYYDLETGSIKALEERVEHLKKRSRNHDG